MAHDSLSSINLLLIGVLSVSNAALAGLHAWARRRFSHIAFARYLFLGGMISHLAAAAVFCVMMVSARQYWFVILPIPVAWVVYTLILRRRGLVNQKGQLQPPVAGS